MKRIFSFLFALVITLGTTGIFTSCQEDAPEINYTVNVTVNNDFTELVNAINNGTLKQTEAIDKLTAAINQMKGEQTANMQALMNAINNLATTLEAKLAIIEAAMKAQTLALEDKLALLTAAVESQTLKQEEMANLLATAIDNLSGELSAKLEAIEAIIESTSATTAEKLAAIEAAMKAQTLALEDKLSLIETALKEQTLSFENKLDAVTGALDAIKTQLEAQEEATDGVAEQIAEATKAIDAIAEEVKKGNLDQKDALKQIIEKLEALKETLAVNLEAIKAIIESTSATTAEKLAAIEAAMKAQTLALEDKLALIEAAINNLPDYSDKLEAIEAAINALPDYSDKLAAIEAAIKALPDYSAKLEAIEAAIKNAPNYTAALVAIKKAIEDLPDYTEQLGAIVTAIETMPDYTEKLGVIAAAIEAIPNYSDKFDAIGTGLEAIKTQLKAQTEATEGVAEKLEALEDLTAAVNGVLAEMKAGNKSQEEALAEIIALLENGAIAGGGGSGEGGTEGEGEGEGTPYIAFTANEEIFINIPEDEYADENGLLVYINTDAATMTQKGSAFVNDSGIRVVILSVTPESSTSEIRLYGNITKFWCCQSSSGLTSLDVSNNTALTHLDCSNNEGLTALDVSNNENLAFIDVRRNDINGTAATTFAESLPDRKGKNTGSLKFSSGSSGKNQFTSEDLIIAGRKNWHVDANIPFGGAADKTSYITFKSTATEVKFYVPGDETTYEDKKGITLIDVEGATIEEYYYANGGVSGIYSKPVYTVKVTTANAGDEIRLYGKITDFLCFNQQLTALDVSYNPNLTYINVSNNKIKGDAATTFVNSLPTRTSAAPGTLIIKANHTGEQNEFTTDDLKIATDKNWKVTDQSGNDIAGEGTGVGSQISIKTKVGTEIRLCFDEGSLPTEITGVVANGNLMNQTFDGISLKGYECTVTDETVIVKGNVSTFYLMSDNINSVDLSKAPELKRLIFTSEGWLGTPSLKSLDVSKNTKLEYLSCSNQYLTSLDLSANTALIYLNCNINNLTALDLSANTALKVLNCNTNKLTALDLSANTALTSLNCNTNQLTSLKVPETTALTELKCVNNKLTSLNVSNCSSLSVLQCQLNKIGEASMKALYQSLPDRTGDSVGSILVKDETSTDEGNYIDDTIKGTGTTKNWETKIITD